MQKALEEARLRLVEMEGLRKKLEGLNTRAIRLDTEVSELKVKMAKIRRLALLSLKSLIPTS